MRLGSMQRLNECDYERARCPEGRMHGGYRKQEFFEIPTVKTEIIETSAKGLK